MVDNRMRSARNAGFTMVELVVVLVVLVSVAGIALLSLSNVSANASLQVTQASLEQLRRASQDFTDHLRRGPTRLVDLFVKPAGAPEHDVTTGLGWRGPYLLGSGGRYHLDTGLPTEPRTYVDPEHGYTLDYAAEGDPVIFDGWNRPIVLQVPDVDSDALVDPDEERHARLVSGGEDGKLVTPRNVLLPSRAACGDDVILFLRIPDTRP